MDELSGRTSVALPEIVFGASRLQLHHAASGVSIELGTVEAMGSWAACQKEGAQGGYSVLKVPSSAQWQASAAGGAADAVNAVNASATESGYDWTFTTDWAGNVTAPKPVSAGAAGTAGAAEREPVFFSKTAMSGIERSLLVDQSVPILLFDEVSLVHTTIRDHAASRLELPSTPRPLPSSMP